ncbi:MAG: Methyl-accepting chemotaxis protein [uncultured Sulfurovum sp.]|uniref:Methyl-accepting chemotaxis protein n=1 Tax=uncultured Sulfurovum sp. TaxID=269237 RepID=A0A6S6UA68_9BACT|nr:MAG: Methyl-accepting chemotaxis protein [uncultured Sulfurovum sp.]
MGKLKKINHEIKCATQQVTVSRTDTEGNIIYCNPTFLEINGFKSSEIIKKPHSIIRHPDMPKTIFRVIWSIVSQGLPIQAVLKNQTNDGKYYWTLISIKPQKDRDNQVISYVAYGKQAPDAVINKIEPLYKILSEIEYELNIDTAVQYLESHLKEEGMSYAQYMKHLTKNREFRCLCDFIKLAILR